MLALERRTLAPHELRDDGGFDRYTKDALGGRDKTFRSIARAEAPCRGGKSKASEAKGIRGAAMRKGDHRRLVVLAHHDSPRACRAFDSP